MSDHVEEVVEIDTESLLGTALVVFTVFAAISFLIATVTLFAPTYFDQHARHFYDATVKVFAILAGFGAAAGFFAAEQSSRMLSFLSSWETDIPKFREKVGSVLIEARKAHDRLYTAILYFLGVSVSGLTLALVKLVLSSPTTRLMFSDFSLLIGNMFLMFAMLCFLLLKSYQLSVIASTKGASTEPTDRSRKTPK